MYNQPISAAACRFCGRIVAAGEPAELNYLPYDEWGRRPCQRQVLLANPDNADEQVIVTAVGNVARFFPFEPDDIVETTLRFDVISRGSQFVNIIYADFRGLRVKD